MVTINFIGDISLFKVYEELNIDPFSEIFLPKSDYNIGNFEFIIPNNRKKQFFDVPDQYSVSFPYFTKLRIDRFNAYGLANNHCFDYGEDGLNDVIKAFKDRHISSFGVGKKMYNPLLFTINNISFAIIACVKKGRWSREEGSFGPDLYDFTGLIQVVEDYKKNVDHVIVFPHWGTELVDVPDPADALAARKLIDAGASAVIGHHPHVIQGVESYNSGIIAYSLGSFIYIPENELGYSKTQNMERNYSMCLQLTFEDKKLIKSNAFYYRYNASKKIPVLAEENSELSEYVKELSININKHGLYAKKIRKVLLRREIKSFIARLKRNPYNTLTHYTKYLKVSHIKKLLGYES